MKFSDLRARSLGHSRARLLHRAAASIGRSSYSWQRTGEAERDLTFWVRSAKLSPSASLKWRTQARQTILDWVGSRCSFTEGRTRLAETFQDAEAEDLTTAELLALRTLTGSVGFFTLTDELLKRAVLRATRDFKDSPSRWSARNAFTAILLCGDLNESLEPLEYWTQFGNPLDPRVIKSFVEMCSHPQSVAKPGQSVTIVGPGPVGELGPHFDLNSPVCRVVMPGVTKWTSQDVVGGRADFGYLNGHTTEWLSSLSRNDREAVINSFTGVRIKKVTEWEHQYPSVRQVSRIKDLFLAGSPNMVPSIVVDQLMNGTESVYVTGTSFFVGSEPYRASERREFYEVGAKSDSFGAINEGTFERCYSHAGHDQVVNRNVIRRLFDAGRVEGDKLFTDVLLMSDAEYLLELENTYGSNRR